MVQGSSRTPSRTVVTNLHAEVQVWLARLDVDDARLRRLAADLSPEELERASRLRFEQDRSRFVAAHAFLRRVLARRLGCSPREVAFRRGATGKPELVPRASARLSELRFNLAHSHDLAACALALDREVGIDVERIREVPGLDDLVRKVLSHREQAALRAWDGEHAAEAFLTAWTRKEAVLKARGEGLTREPRGVEISLDAHGPARLLAVVGDPGAEQRWAVHAVDAGSEYVAAVAAAGDDWLVRRIWDSGLADLSASS